MTTNHKIQGFWGTYDDGFEESELDLIICTELESEYSSYEEFLQDAFAEEIQTLYVKRRMKCWGKGLK